jgi:hypothetical protein
MKVLNFKTPGLLEDHLVTNLCLWVVQIKVILIVIKIVILKVVQKVILMR